MPSAARHGRRVVREGSPNCSFSLDSVDGQQLGAFLPMMEFQTAFLGGTPGRRRFDEEGVESGKKFTYPLTGAVQVMTNIEITAHRTKRAAKMTSLQ